MLTTVSLVRNTVIYKTILHDLGLCLIYTNDAYHQNNAMLKTEPQQHTVWSRQ